MRKWILLVLVIGLLVAPVNAARFGAGMRMGFVGNGFDVNLHGSFMLSSSIEIEPSFDFVISGATIISGIFKYHFNVPSVIPYAGLGAGLWVGYNTAGFALPFSAGVAVPLGSSFYLNAELRPILFIGEYGGGFSFGFEAGVTYYF
ncbi:hypothetical protein K8R78_02190 [bacterium]|nr:hypothetical protein [bacterium]